MSDHECPSCGRIFDSEHGLIVHCGRYCDPLPWQDPEVLSRLYYDEGLGIYEIADRLGTGREAVRRQMEKHDLARERPTPWRDEAVLRELYCELKLGLAEIAERLGTNRESVRCGLIHHDIDRRGKGEGHSLRARREPARYETTRSGYERWTTKYHDETSIVPVHRLAAVAWFGLEAVEGKYVHHENPIPWLNVEDNLKPMEPSDHSAHHANEHADKIVRDEGGRIVGLER